MVFCFFRAIPRTDSLRATLKKNPLGFNLENNVHWFISFVQRLYLLIYFREWWTLEVLSMVSVRIS